MRLIPCANYVDKVLVPGRTQVLPIALYILEFAKHLKPRSLYDFLKLLLRKTQDKFSCSLVTKLKDLDALYF